MSRLVWGRKEETDDFHLSDEGRSESERARTLTDTSSTVCPVRSMIHYMNSFDWGCEGDARLFSDDVEKRVRSITKWSATSDGMMARKFSTHSLLSGGATAQYARGISIEHIRRFGRCASDTSRRYLYRDNQVSASWAMQRYKLLGMLDQLQMTQPEPKSVNFEEDDIMEEDGERFRAGWKIRKTSSTQPSPGKLDVNISEMGDCETDTESGGETDEILPGCHLGSLQSVTETSEEDAAVGSEASEATHRLGVQNETALIHRPESVLR